MKNLKRFNENLSTPKDMGTNLKLLYRKETDPHDDDVYIGSKSLLSYIYVLNNHDKNLTDEQKTLLNELYDNIENYIKEAKKEKFRKEDLETFQRKLNYRYPNDPKPNFWH